MPVFMDKGLSRFRCGFREDFTAQYYLKTVLEKWKKSRGRKNLLITLIANS